MSWWQPLRDTIVQNVLGIPKVLQHHGCDSRVSLRGRRQGGTNVDITRCAEITGGFVSIVNVLAGNCNTGNVGPLSYLEETKVDTAEMKFWVPLLRGGRSGGGAVGVSPRLAAERRVWLTAADS